MTARYSRIAEAHGVGFFPTNEQFFLSDREGFPSQRPAKDDKSCIHFVCYPGVQTHTGLGQLGLKEPFVVLNSGDFNSIRMDSRSIRSDEISPFEVLLLSPVASFPS